MLKNTNKIYLSCIKIKNENALNIFLKIFKLKKILNLKNYKFFNIL